MNKTARRCWTLGAAALLTLPGFTAVAAVLTTSALDFSNTLTCSATNVGPKPLSVTIELLSPQSGEAINTPVTTTLDPGFGRPTSSRWRLASRPATAASPPAGLLVPCARRHAARRRRTPVARASPTRAETPHVDYGGNARVQSSTASS
jgi:hypothetical protein